MRGGLSEVLNRQLNGAGVAIQDVHNVSAADQHVSPQLALRRHLHSLQRVLGRLSLNFSGIGRFLGSIGSNFSIVQAFADELQLPIKETNLNRANNNQPESEYRNRLTRLLPPSFLLLLIAVGFLGLRNCLGYRAGSAMTTCSAIRTTKPTGPVRQLISVAFVASASANRRAEDVGIETVVISELKLGNVQR